MLGESQGAPSAPSDERLREVRIHHGIDVPLAGQPRQELGEPVTVDSVALLAEDAPRTLLDTRVEVGARVDAGQVVLVDRLRPAIAFTTSIAGTVRELRHGPSRRVAALMIEADPEPRAPEPAEPSQPLSATTDEAVRAALLAHGLWPAFITRPFGDIPEPDALADAIFVTAIDTQPLAPDPQVVIAAHREAFEHGLQALRALTRGRVVVCQAPGPALAPDAAVFRGPHPAGLAGTHIHYLHPALTAASQVWAIGYQDVIATGYLLHTGRPWHERVIALAGPAVLEPRLVSVPRGARLASLAEGHVEADAHLISGSVLHGRVHDFLGSRHLQVTGLRRVQTARRGPIVPVAELERATPLCGSPVPLLRALSVGDDERAIPQGALGLLEEDMALLSYACPSQSDYGSLLRTVLERWRGGPNEAGAPASGAPPFVRVGRSTQRIDALFVLALLPPLVLRAQHGGMRWAGVLLVSVAVTFAWEFLFAHTRRRRLGTHGAVTALGLALLMPDAAPLGQVALGASFGVVMAEQAFGGYGYGFLHPSVASLAFLAVSFPEAGYGGPVPLSWLAVLPGALVLVGAGVVSVRVVLGFAVGAIGLAYVLGVQGMPGPHAVGTGALALLALGCEPVSAACTQPGRLIYGLVIGGFAALGLRHGDASLVLPVLLAQLLAPLIDRAVVISPGRVAFGGRNGGG